LVCGHTVADLGSELRLTGRIDHIFCKFDPFVTFEWIGLKNYLKEPGKRQRGKWVTNVDVLFRFRQNDNRIHLVLVEWKYTESYQKAKVNQFSRSGTDRLEIYGPLLTRTSAKKNFRWQIYQTLGASF